MDTSRAIIIGAAIIAAAVLFLFRWEIQPAVHDLGTSLAYRLDRWTGTVTICHYPPGYDTYHPTYKLECASQ